MTRSGGSGKRALLLAVAVLLCAAAALAIAILLFGDFGSTEGRILATTAILAGYSVLALPAAILYDQRRLRALAAAVAVLAAAGCAFAIAGIWSRTEGDTIGKTMGSVTVWLVASSGVAALSARRRAPDPAAVAWLFRASCALAAVAASMVTVAIWVEPEDDAYARALGALVVLELLLVSLQPLLARARPATRAVRLRLTVASGETVELEIDAPDLAAAAAKAIRTLEGEGRQVLRLEAAGSRDRDEAHETDRELGVARRERGPALLR